MRELFAVEFLPHAFAGAAVGLGAFGVLMSVLLPILRHKSRVSLPKGLLAVMVSFVILTLGVAASCILSRDSVVMFLIGELAAFFACWGLLAAHIMSGVKR